MILREGIADDLPIKVDELDNSQEVPELLRLTVGLPLIDQPESLGFFDLRCGDINSSSSLVNRGVPALLVVMLPAVKALMVVMLLSAVSGRGAFREGEVSS